MPKNIGATPSYPRFSRRLVAPKGPSKSTVSQDESFSQSDWFPAIDEEPESVVRRSRTGYRLKNYLWVDHSRWLLYLYDTDENGSWHLFRVDLDTPSKPAIDLTPMPQGSRVFTVDPLTVTPARVLVTMNKLRGHTDYFLIDVETGEMTVDLPGKSGRLLSDPTHGPRKAGDR